MTPRKNKTRYEDTAEYKKDVVHEIRFIKGDKNFGWFRLWGDPKERPSVIQDAIKEFENKHGISDWHTIADSYETQSYWNG